MTIEKDIEKMTEPEVFEQAIFWLRDRRPRIDSASSRYEQFLYVKEMLTEVNKLQKLMRNWKAEIKTAAHIHGEEI